MNAQPEKRVEAESRFSFDIAEYAKQGRENEVTLSKALRTVLNGRYTLAGKDLLTYVREHPDSPEAESFKDGKLYHFYKTKHNDLACLQYKNDQFIRSLHALSDYWHTGDSFVIAK